MHPKDDVKVQIDADSALSQTFQRTVARFIEKLAAEGPAVLQKDADRKARAKAEGRIESTTLICLNDLFETAEQKETYVLALVMLRMRGGQNLTQAVQAVHRDIEENHAEINYTAE
jgi:hypothetical protein